MAPRFSTPITTLLAASLTTTSGGEQGMRGTGGREEKRGKRAAGKEEKRKTEWGKANERKREEEGKGNMRL